MPRHVAHAADFGIEAGTPSVHFEVTQARKRKIVAGLVGGMGMAPSGDVGDQCAVFQPSHGTAPDIAGQGIADPASLRTAFNYAIQLRDAAA